MNIEGPGEGRPAIYWGNNSVFDELKEQGMENWLIGDPG
jgi:hypothetical protein